MSERQIEKIPLRTKRYVAVMAEAARRAHSRSVTASAFLRFPRNSAPPLAGGSHGN